MDTLSEFEAWLAELKLAGEPAKPGMRAAERLRQIGSAVQWIEEMEAAFLRSQCLAFNAKHQGELSLHVQSGPYPHWTLGMTQKREHQGQEHRFIDLQFPAWPAHAAAAHVWEKMYSSWTAALERVAKHASVHAVLSSA